jgi:hypothetical protein
MFDLVDKARILHCYVAFFFGSKIHIFHAIDAKIGVKNMIVKRPRLDL